MSSYISAISLTTQLRLSEEEPEWLPHNENFTVDLSLSPPGDSDVTQCNKMYGDKIKSLKNTQEIIGISFLQDEQDTFHPVYIRNSITILSPRIDDTLMAFYIHKLSDATMIGVAQVSHVIDSEFKVGWINNFSSMRGGKIKKVAVLLTQVIHQYLLSEIGKNYKLTLNTIHGAASYHYRSGFLTNNEGTNVYLNECMCKKDHDTKVCDNMVLSIEGRRFWQKEVFEHPIRF